MGNQLNPVSSSVTNSQARQFAEESGTCSDGTECGSHPIELFGGDGFCAQCPNRPDDESEWALLDQRLNGSRDTGDVLADKHSAPWFLERGLLHMSDRAVTYDTPGGERSMGATVAAYKAVTGDDRLTSESQGWLFMVLLKLVRSQQGEFKANNFEHATAYCGLMGEAAAEEYQDE